MTVRGTPSVHGVKHAGEGFQVTVSQLYDANGSNLSTPATKTVEDFPKVIGIVYLDGTIAARNFSHRVHQTEQEGKYFFCLMANNLIKSNNNDSSSCTAPTGWHVQSCPT